MVQYVLVLFVVLFVALFLGLNETLGGPDQTLFVCLPSSDGFLYLFFANFC